MSVGDYSGDVVEQRQVGVVAEKNRVVDMGAMVTVGEDKEESTDQRQAEKK